MGPPTLWHQCQLVEDSPSRRLLSYATAKLLRDEAESMVPSIDPE